MRSPAAGQRRGACPAGALPRPRRAHTERSAAVKHVYPAAIRFDDLDSFGHVNNVVLLEYLQEARIDFAHQYMYSAASRHEGSVVAYQSIDCLAPDGPRSAPLRA